MLIECSACRAVFSLQDGAAPAGSRFRVQCGRCHAVFEVAAPARTAFPAQGEGSPAAPPEAGQAPALPADEIPNAVSQDEGGAPPPISIAKPALVLAPEPPPPPTVLDGPPAPSAAPRLSRRGWTVIGGAVALVVAVGAVLLARGGAADVDGMVRRGRELLLRDDRKSLEQATGLFTDAARAAPGQAVPEAERAFALLLQASAARDMERRAPAGDRERLDRDAAKLLQQGAAAAREALSNDTDAPAALRAAALAEAIEGKPEDAAAHVQKAEASDPGDAWVLYVKGAAAAAAHRQDQAVQALSAARQAQPELLRVDVDLAAISLDAGDSGGARALLEGVLRRNSRHERARLMLSSIGP